MPTPTKTDDPVPTIRKRGARGSDHAYSTAACLVLSMDRTNSIVWISGLQVRPVVVGQVRWIVHVTSSQVYMQVVHVTPAAPIFRG
ncbi:hypothetical protein N7447_009308 [Penicillium robsamsonii]|uniref:uncharacterized protein n=1 Tax=Penicillium robsamsonii TaxID=1792511 RepID=UPI002546D986|nr:uncharacterized protein N7447_009308 [Penicillium robsamsonii]KAJ5817075.1 hypothetical protein N7447_009308 [Penicillium robsamsonii]